MKFMFSRQASSLWRSVDYETPLRLPILINPSYSTAAYFRYLEYEKEHGDAASVSHVKQLAMEFVKAMANA